MVKQVVALVATALCFGALAGGVRAGDVTFTVINDSSYDLVSFYAAPINARAWGNDLLETEKGRFTLRAQSSGEARIAGGAEQCLYDLKYILSDGETYYKRDLDICRLSSYRIFD